MNKLCLCGCGKEVVKEGNQYIYGHVWLGRHHSEKTKQKIGEGNRGKTVSEKSKRKISEAHKGMYHSRESKKKISKATSGEKHWNYGNHHSEETKRKISEAHKGKHFSKEIRSKMSESHKGHIVSEEIRVKMKESAITRPMCWNFSDTDIELKLQEEMDKRQIGYLPQVQLYGRPDMFLAPGICVFCDGDYWHNYPNGTERDRNVTEYLITHGRGVIRFWGSEIMDDVESCVDRIVEFQKQLGYELEMEEEVEK